MFEKIEKFAAEKISLTKFEFNALFLLISMSLLAIIFNYFDEESLSQEEKNKLIAVLDSIAEAKANPDLIDELQEIDLNTDFQAYKNNKVVEKIDLRTASNLQLMTLPGVGEKTAQSIIDFRNKFGIKSNRDLLKVKRIGEKTLNKILPFLVQLEQLEDEVNNDEKQIEDEANVNNTNLQVKQTSSKSVEIANNENLETKEKVESKKEEINISSKVNLNTANVQELMQLPGIGEKTAQKIIEYRENKKFSNIEEIVNVKGISQKKFEKIKNFIEIR